MTKPKPGLQDGTLTHGQKAQIVTYASQNPKANQNELATWATKTFKTSQPVHRSSISRILKRKHEYATMTTYEINKRHRRTVAHPALEAALVSWILEMGRRKRRLSKEIIQAKGHELATRILDVSLAAEFKFSNGWFESFCKRNAFKSFSIHGESGDAQMDNIEDQINEIKAKIASYSPEDVYNMDETAYFYNLAPDKTIARRQIEGAKKDKIRLTIALTCNTTGTDRFELLILGHAEKPRCFKKKTARELGFYYMSNTKAWMTAQFFQNFLVRFNNHVKRKVLLLVDNAPSHLTTGVNHANVEIINLPPNTTSKLQPLDAGIIAAFKCRIRKRQLAYALDALESEKNPYKVDQLTAMQWARTAWSTLDASTIQNCWRHTGLMNMTINNNSIPDPIAESDIVEDYQHFIKAANIKDAMVIDEFVNPAEEQLEMEELEYFEEYIIETAKTVEIDEAQEEAEKEVLLLYSDLSKEEEIKALAMAIAIYERKETTLSAMDSVVEALRKVQKKIRWELVEEKEQKSTQLSITQFLRH
jgi:hypothetical protein